MSEPKSTAEMIASVHGGAPLYSLAGTAQRMDSWGNVFSQIGIAGRDKSASNSFFSQGRIPRRVLEDLYRDDGIAGRIIDVPADDATREWFELKVTAADEDGDGMTLDEAAAIAMKVQRDLRRLRAPLLLNRALKWEALYGGSVILMGIDDGQTDPEEPVRMDAVKGVRWLQVLHAEQVVPGQVVSDVKSPRFGQPETYVVESSIEVGTESSTWHWTRVMAFHGISIPDDIQDQNNGWGDPVLRRNFDPLSHFWIAQKGTATLAQEWGTVVYGIKDLARILESDNGAALITRMQINQRMRSMVNAHLIDSENESLSRDTPGVAGLDAIQHRQELALTATSGMPPTKLFGVSPSGFAATDENALINWNAVVGSRQENSVSPELMRLVELIMVASDGPTGGVVPEAWRIDWNPMTKPTQKSALEIRKLAAEADALNIDRGVYSPDEAATRYTGDEFSTDVTLDEQTREEFSEAEGEDDGTAEEIQGEVEAPAVDAVKPENFAAKLLEVSKAVAAGDVPREAGIAILVEAFGLSPQDAAKIVGPEPEEETTPPAAPGVMAPEMIENAAAMQEAFAGDGDGDGDTEEDADEDDT